MSLAFIPDTSKPVLPSYVKKVEPIEVPVQVANTPPALNTEVDFDLLDEEEWLAARGLENKSFGPGYFTGSGQYLGDADEDDGAPMFDTDAELLIEYKYLSWLVAKLVDGITAWGNAVGGVPDELHTHYEEAWDYVNGDIDDDDDDDDIPFDRKNILK
jgi:hypothetical protein